MGSPVRDHVHDLLAHVGEESVHLPLLPFQLSLLDSLIRDDGIAVLAAGLGLAQVSWVG